MFNSISFPPHSAAANAFNDDLCPQQQQEQLDFVKSVVVIQETKLHQAAEYVAYQGGVYRCFPVKLEQQRVTRLTRG